MLKSISQTDFLNKAADFIISLEGFVSTAFWDNKQWTWGYGTAAGYNPVIKPTGTITKATARFDLLSAITPLYNTLISSHFPFSINQAMGFVSFGFNTGAMTLMVSRLESGWAFNDVLDKMNEYVHAGGQLDTGLINRRKIETNKILTV